MLTLYNTATRKKEEFKPIVPGRVGMYVCGVTVYDRCHIGHARSAVVFDAIVRYLEYLGYKVTYVRNFTDVDDKIIARANQEGIDSAEVAQRNIEAFYEDMNPLGLRRPDVEPRATEHIAEIIKAVSGLVDKAAAYESQGDVYFAVDNYAAYGDLSGRNLDDMRAGARVAVDERKRNPYDFALWKTSKPGEPSWESPWGRGRPGWHIECSAMSSKYLGLPFDIHGGGEDLIFPHHENEKAQAEALTGGRFVNYWMHNGFVRIDQEKMSKSLGNFLTIQDILKKYHPEVLRLFLLSAHYRSPLDYSQEAMAEADEGLSRLYETLARIQTQLAVERPAEGGPLADLAAKTRELFLAAMDNDFNSAQAMGHLFSLARAANRALETGKKLGGLQTVPETLTELAGVLGLLSHAPEDFASEREALLVNRDGLDPKAIQRLVEERTRARQDKDFAKADQIRDRLVDLGVVILDSPEGTTWRLKG